MRGEEEVNSKRKQLTRDIGCFDKCHVSIQNSNGLCKHSNLKLFLVDTRVDSFSATKFIKNMHESQTSFSTKYVW